MSNDCIAVIGIQLIAVTYFYTYPLTSFWFSIDLGLRFIFFKGGIGESLFTFSTSLTYAHHYLMKLIK